MGNTQVTLTIALPVFYAVLIIKSYTNLFSGVTLLKKFIKFYKKDNYLL